MVRRLEDDLLSGRLNPGERLRIASLKKRYKCGATPIREALSRLSAQSLVEKLENRGFRAAPLSKNEFDEVLRARNWLEDRALRESIARGDDAWEEEIVLAHFRLRATQRFSDDAKTIQNLAWEAVHKRFHMALIGACGSSILLGFCSDLYDRNTRYRNAAAQSSSRYRNLEAEHDRLKDLVISRQADAAVETLLEHYSQTGNRINLSSFD
jgi:DNA-binding GntR family transcriptional regulator